MSGELVEVGRVTHYFSKISVAVVELKAPPKGWRQNSHSGSHH